MQSGFNRIAYYGIGPVPVDVASNTPYSGEQED